MSEDDIERIRKSFVRATDKCPSEVACLLTVMKYYGVEEEARKLTEWCKVDGKITLMGMKEAAIRTGLKAEICIQDIEQLQKRQLPIVIFFINEMSEIGYVVCFGMHGERLIMWEPTFGPMQYWPEELRSMWIKGISLTLFPTPEFFAKADFHLKWWELYDWSKKWKRKCDRAIEYYSLNIRPRLRF